MEENKIYYVYYSYEQFGRGYIGYRGCEYEKGYTPETEPYWGTYFDKRFKPTEKIILFQDLTRAEALEIEIYLHNYYDIDNNDHFANLAKQKSAGFYCDITGKIKINNGEKEKLIFPDEEIPEGYFCGSKIKGVNHPNHGKSVYNNDLEEKYFYSDKEIPHEFIPGRLEKYKQKLSGENSSSYGKKHYNNGINERLFSPEKEIPEGYILGCLTSKENHPLYGQTRSKETRGKISAALAGTICINNGEREKHIFPGEEIPEGFVLGRSEKTKHKLSESHKGENHNNYGKKLYNNGIKNKYFPPDEEIPEGYIKGGLNKGKKLSKEHNIKSSEARKIKVITSLCCYFSIGEAIKELGISGRKFKKLFEKDSKTGFYIERQKIV